MRGGVLSKVPGEEIRDQVYRILIHPLTKIEYMSRGKFGQIFKVTYYGTDSGFVEGAEHVKVFILKVQGINIRLKHTSRNDPNRPKKDYEDFNDLYPYTDITSWDELSKEVQLQQNIIKCALDKHLMPPCPSILFHEGITAEQFETFLPGQFVYKVGEDRLEEVKPIHSRHFKDCHMGIIFMEYVQSEELPNVYERYKAKVYEIESKALRAYCTALQCGVLQSDPNPQNFLLTEDDNVVLIDFGVARPLTPAEVVEIDKLVKKAEAGDSEELRLKLTEMEDPDNKCLHKLIFRPTLLKSGKVRYPTLAPAIHLSKEIEDQYKEGLYVPTPTMHDSAKMAHIQRREMDPMDRKERKEAEKEELELHRQESKRQRFWGGKRHTKYVGTRKRVGTRRKV